MSQTKTTNITLEVSAEIDLNGLSIEDLERHLHAALSRAIGNGLLTGDTQAEVEQYSATVNVDRHSAHEARIYQFLQDQIEGGHLDAASMATRITRYGLMLPSDFIAEMDERAELSRQDVD